MTKWCGWATVALAGSISVQEMAKVERFAGQELKALAGSDIEQFSVAQVIADGGRAVRLELTLADEPDDPEGLMLNALHRGLINVDRAMPNLTAWGASRP